MVTILEQFKLDLEKAIVTKDLAFADFIIRNSNIPFPVPPVCTAYWNSISWAKYILSYLTKEENKK